MKPDLKKLIQDFSDKFPADTAGPYHATPNTKIITETLPAVFTEELSLGDEYKIYGSVGRGNWSEVPWVAVLDRAISTSTEDGYYVVVLFDKPLQNIYLSLAVGWVQFREEYGTKEGRAKIRALCDYYASQLSTRPDGFRSGVIELRANNALAEGYERGSIISKKYSISGLSGEVLLDDIRKLLESYKELKTIVGDSVLNLEVDSANDETITTFKKKVAAESFSKDTPESIARLIQVANEAPPEVRTKLKKEIVRNRKFANYVKVQAKFICQVCGREPFIQANGTPYAEADHIMPLGGNTKGLDSPDNMRCLCAQCHAVLTHGSEDEKRRLLETSKGGS